MNFEIKPHPQNAKRDWILCMEAGFCLEVINLQKEQSVTRDDLRAYGMAFHVRMGEQPHFQGPEFKYYILQRFVLRLKRRVTQDDCWAAIQHYYRTRNMSWVVADSVSCLTSVDAIGKEDTQVSNVKPSVRTPDYDAHEVLSFNVNCLFRGKRQGARITSAIPDRKSWEIVIDHQIYGKVIRYSTGWQYVGERLSAAEGDYFVKKVEAYVAANNIQY
jgi:hypothetical protein